jgi:Tol biopolymer transport system component
VDATGAYVVRDAADKALKTVRFNEKVEGPLLSPDGTRVVGSVRRDLPPIGGVSGASEPGVGVFDLDGREITSVSGYDDATWTPDGKIIATGGLYEPGLFELDPATKSVRPIDAKVASPFSPSVSPDGKTIAFVTGEKVWLIDRADGKNLRQFLLDGHSQQRPIFSPDGSKIAMVVCNTMAADMTGEVFVIDRTTAEITPLRTSMGATLVPDTTTKLNWIP